MPSPILKAGSRPPWFTILGVASDIGDSMGFLPGIACNKFPPWAVLLVSCVLCFLGYGVLWLVVSKTIGSLPFLVIWIALCIATNSNAWFGTAVLVTTMRNFPLSRGTVAGILKGYIGLSTAVYTVIYSTVLEDSALNLLLLLAPGLPVLYLALMYFIRPCTAVLEKILRSMPIFSSPLRWQCDPNRSFVHTILISCTSWKFHEAEFASDIETLLAIGEGAIGIALGASNTTILLSLFSFCNFVGHLGSGAVSEHFLRKKTVPRTVWMACAHIVMIVSFVLYALSINGTLYVATALFGICYGAQYSLMVPTASELFGLKHFLV
ncbi:hypothetical protein ACFX13_047616 [Malus domestica]